MTGNHGGPAFPNPGTYYLERDKPRAINDSVPGMTLRDYFAAKAMQSMVAGPGAKMVADRDERYDETNWDFIVASNAYNVADAMLAEREKWSK